MFERLCDRYPRFSLLLVGLLYLWASISDAPYRLAEVAR